MMAKTVYKLRATIDVKFAERAKHKELYPKKRQRVEFEGELKRGKPQGKGYEWVWSITEESGAKIAEGTLLSSGTPIDSILRRMKAAARHKCFGHAHESDLTYTGWSLR